MTHDIANMPAGPELDRLACEALGIEGQPQGNWFCAKCDSRVCSGDHGQDDMEFRVYGVRYISISGNGYHALYAMGQVRGMTLRYGHDKDGEWTAKALVPGFAYEKYVDASADTAALAIARAIAMWGAKP